VARPAEVVPAKTACPGGCIYEIKFDGYRLAVVRTNSAVKLWSRRGTDLTSASVGLMILKAFAIPCVARLSECLPVRDTCCAHALAEGFDRLLFCVDGVCHRRGWEGSYD
jgi:hypothetical protein